MRYCRLTMNIAKAVPAVPTSVGVPANVAVLERSTRLLLVAIVSARFDIAGINTARAAASIMIFLSYLN